MNELVEIVSERNGVPITTSLIVAEKFGKRHQEVLYAIEGRECSCKGSGCKKCNGRGYQQLGLLQEDLEINAKSHLSKMFKKSSYKDNGGRKRPLYYMDKDGFTLLAMGFTGEKALRWKIDYIKAFDAMEEYIRSIQTAKLDYPAFTRAIEQAHEKPKFYHFSNEINMINRIELGTDAKHFKEENGIDKKENSIRPYLTAEQIKTIEELQRIDIGLLIANIEFEQRKQIIKTHYTKSICGLEVKT